MIAYLDGLLSYKEPAYTIIDVKGIGYEVFISLQTYSTLPGGGDKVKLFIHHHFREDNQTLFGFANADEKNLFRELISVSGVGPNTALGMLSTMSPQELRLAIMSENVRAIQAIKGIGAKTAQRIILELKDRMKKAGLLPDVPTYRKSAANPIREEAIAALSALGFPRPSAEKSVDDIMRAEPELSVEDIIRRGLR
jgi:holliday junction DNA helicase RuvA